MPLSHREQLLEGAIECVQTRGVAATTTRDIAAASGASLASIPYHFGSKDALMDEALVEATSRYTRQLKRQSFAADTAPLQRLAASLGATLDSFAETRPLLISIMEAHVKALHSERLRTRVADHRRAAIERIAATVREVGLGVDGELADADSEALAVIALALIDGLMLGWLVDPESTPSAEALTGAIARAVGPLLGAPASEA